MAATGVILTFILIFYLSLKKVDLWKVMFLATMIMAATSGLSVEDCLRVTGAAIIDPATIELAAAVLAISIFSTVMQRLGFLQNTVSGLTDMLGNVKAAIMTVPALIGSMPVLGGAALSAPLVDRLGEPLNLSPAKKAAANLVFRHGMFFIFPFSPSLILAANLTAFSVPTIISRIGFMSIVLWGMGYFVLLRKEEMIHDPKTIAETSATATKMTNSRSKGFFMFTKYGGPLLLSLAAGLILKWPLYLALSAGTVIALLLGTYEKVKMPDFAAVVKNISWGQILAMFSIMTFKAFVTISPVFPLLVEKATAAGVSPAIMAAILPIAFGFGSASQTATIGVLLPILVSPTFSEAVRLNLIGLIYAGSFAAYLFSPLHLCQVLTCQYFKIEIPDVYKLNWPIIVGFMVIVGSYTLMLLRMM